MKFYRASYESRSFSFEAYALTQDEAHQQMVSDVTDLINGETYKAIGYDGQKDFLKEMQRRLDDLEYNLTHD